MEPKKRILFVDDEPNILNGLRRILRGKRREWDMQFVTSGAEALQILQAADPPFHVILSDMRMPGMDGAELLREVMHQHPHMVRIVLSGQADRDDILQAVGPIHQYLSKPSDAGTLKAVLTRALTLDDLLSNPHLKQQLSRLETLPSQPAIHNELITELQSSTPAPEALAGLVAQDIGMSAKVLQLVNSAFLGMARHVPGPDQAVNVLGIDTLKVLGLSVKIFTALEPSLLEIPGLAKLGPHSMQVGRCAKAIAAAENADQKTVDYAFIAGLLHDVGKLALATILPGQYHTILSTAANNGGNLLQAEYKNLKTTHAEVGAYLLGLWGLPQPVVDALAHHHQPGQYPARQFNAVTAVHIANALINSEANTPAVDEPYLQQLGLADHLAQWQNICKTTSNP